jgi:hypothetical protein
MNRSLKNILVLSISIFVLAGSAATGALAADAAGEGTQLSDVSKQAVGNGREAPRRRRLWIWRAFVNVRSLGG